MRQGGPPISFRPGQPSPNPPNQNFNMNRFTSPMGGGMPGMGGGQFLGGPVPNNFGGNQQFQQGPSKIGLTANNNAQQNPMVMQKSKMYNPIGSNLEQKYIKHLGALETAIKKELQALPGTELYNASQDANNYELFLSIFWTAKCRNGDMPLKCKVSHKFPGEAPKLYVMNPARHKLIDQKSLEIDYSPYYRFSAAFKIIDLFNATQQYFNSNPVEVNPAIDRKIGDLTTKMSHQAWNELKNTNIKDFYEQLTPSEKKEFSDDQKRLDLLKRVPKFREFTDEHEKLVRIASSLKTACEEKNKKYETECFEMLAKLQEFEALKQGAYDKYSSCLMIQERFTKRQLLTILENQVAGYKESYTAADLKTRLEQCGDQQSMSDTLMKFVDGRSQVHLGFIRCEKMKAGLA